MRAVASPLQARLRRVIPRCPICEGQRPSDLNTCLVCILVVWIGAEQLPAPKREARFDRGGRRWRFDLCWPDLLIAAEVDGGTWSGGRHTRGRGFEDDAEKVNAATLQGWRVYRFTRTQVLDGRAGQVLRRALTAPSVPGARAGAGEGVRG